MKIHTNKAYPYQIGAEKGNTESSNTSNYQKVTYHASPDFEQTHQAYVHELMSVNETGKNFESTTFRPSTIGEIYNDGDYYIRPVQKCEKYYGESVIINKLTFEGDRFREEIIAEIEPDMRKRRGIGLHTLNKMNGICVIDGKDYRYPIIGRLYNQIKKRIKG